MAGRRLSPAELTLRAYRAYEAHMESHGAAASMDAFLALAPQARRRYEQEARRALYS